MSTPAGTAPTWQNWCGNITHLPPTNGANYYFTPTNLSELKAVLVAAQQQGVTVRVSGQRHSQPPLVTGQTDTAPAKPDTFLVDMSCYVDIGTTGMMLGPGPNQITVNPGVREDAVDAFLTQNNLMFQTVTAGGFFSLGGMTAVDVHGGTVAAPIFAETAASFVILGADGNLHTIDANSPAVNGFSPRQFARVSLGGLGIVTQIVLDVKPRPYANTLQGSTQRYLLQDQNAFVTQMQALLTGPNKHDRVEVFYSPYAAAPNLPFPTPFPNFLVLGWNEVANPVPAIPNNATTPDTACSLAHNDKFGAPVMGGLAGYGAQFVRASQYYSNPYNPFQLPPVPTAGYTAIALDEIQSQANTAIGNHSDLWLAEASQVMFMSYFFELPNLDTAGLNKVWAGLETVASRVIQNDQFHIAAPVEFRFIKGGDSAMSSTYTTNPNATFLNLDLIGFIQTMPSSQYNPKLLQFFADVERDWVAMGGFPHNGKMYGFYDPTDPNPTSYTAAFNPNYLAALRQRRGARLQAFKAYRASQDPNGLFYNAFLKQLLEG